jgi:glutamyl/glutaminyl-tRNA synthetase
VLALHQSRAHTLRELADSVLPYFQANLVYDPAACAKFLKDPTFPGQLEALRRRYAESDFTKEALEAELRAQAEAGGVKAGVLIHPTRMALSSATGGPPLFDLVEAMGREAALRHLDQFIVFLKDNAANAAPAAG